MNQRMVLWCLPALALMLVGCSSNSKSNSAPQGTAAVHGIQVRLSPSELSYASDAVVIGTAGSQIVQPFTANKLIPKSAHGEEGYAEGSFLSTHVQVTEVLKGNVNPDPSVASLHSLGQARDAAISGDVLDASTLKPGQDYVLFLTKGTDLWAGHYLTLGPQGVGAVRGDVVRFASGATIELKRLTQQVQSPTSPSGTD